MGLWRAGGVALPLEPLHFPSNHEALNLNPSTTKTNQNKTKTQKQLSVKIRAMDQIN
jgi:hypothetical protein